MDLTPASERDLVWQWASAEVNSTRFCAPYRQALPPLALAALERGDAASLSDEEWTHLAVVVFSVRGPLLNGLKRLGTSWYLGKMPPSDLELLRMMNWPPFHAASPSLRLAEMVRALDRDEELPEDPDFAPNYRALKATFDVALMKGAPILVGQLVDGPYGVLEGYSRLAVLLSRRLEEGDDLPETAVVVGVCARIQEWRLHDDANQMKLYWE